MKSVEKKGKKLEFRTALVSIFGYLKTLISNKACIDRGTGISTLTNKKEGVKKTWYIAVIFFLLSMFFSVLPLGVHANAQDGSTAFQTYNYGAKEAIISATLNDNSYHAVGGNFANLTFNENNNLSQTLTWSDEANSQGYNYIGYHTAVINKEGTEGSIDQSIVKDFDFYFVSDASYSTVIDTITDSTYEYSSTTGIDLKAPLVDRNCSFMVFTETTVYISVRPHADLGSASNPINIKGDFLNLGNVNGKTIEDIFTSNITDSTTNSSDAIYQNFLTFTDNIYHNNKVQAMWIQIGICLGVNGGLTLILGLVVFLMTRGKNNPNREIKWYQSFLIVFYASLCPAILSLAFGFLFTGMEIMLYVITFGFRVMWMSVKSLRPVYQ